MNFILGIMVGIMISGIVNRIYISNYSKKMFEAVQYECLSLLAWTYEDFVYLKEKKQMMMHKMEVPLNEIKTTKNVDEENIRRWQKTAINKFLLSVPARYRPLIKYTNWRTAMTHVRIFIKKP
tara:strand:- start:332 stop:700 length:369 start_codon:yes stop_codon:yes gene_type:complete